MHVVVKVTKKRKLLGKMVLCDKLGSVLVNCLWRDQDAIGLTDVPSIHARSLTSVK